MKRQLPAKAKTALSIAAAAGVSILTFHQSIISDSHSVSRVSSLVPPNFSQNVGITGVVRFSRAIATIASNVFDYKYSLLGLSVDCDEYQATLSKVHLRSANRILKLCEANKGFYVKAGQFIAALRQVPREYSSTLSSLQDQAVPCHFKAIKEVLINNLGEDLYKIFLSFDEQPIAAASVAQVHRALLKNHQEVAIKVQYPGLEDQMKLDLATMSFLSRLVAWLFPEYRFEWLVSEFANIMALEIDFIQEARNADKTAKYFTSNNKLKVPYVFWDLTTRQVLTMQFCKGCKVDDLDSMKKMGINPEKVAKVLLEVFAEMIFIHGFLHGDPHPGNILVSPDGPDGFSLVLLDHGLYRQLDEEFRIAYCHLWGALVCLDSNKINHLGEQFGIGKYSKYFPLIFTGRTINSKSALGRGLSLEERRNIKQELKSLKMEEVSMFMESLPPDLIAILRADGLLRSVASKLGASRRVRLLAYAKFALYGLSPKLNTHSGSAVKAIYSLLKTNIMYLRLRVLLVAAELLSWMDQIKESFLKRFGDIHISPLPLLVKFYSFVRG